MGQAQGALARPKSSSKQLSTSNRKTSAASLPSLCKPEPELQQSGELPARVSGSSEAPSTPSIRDAGPYGGRKSLSRFHPNSEDSRRCTNACSDPGNARDSSDGPSGRWLGSFEGPAGPGSSRASRGRQSFESWVTGSDRTHQDTQQSSPSRDGPKRSFDSAGSSSARSSFARERPSLEQPLVEAVGQKSGLVAETLSKLAEELHYMYLSLAVLQPDVPVPISSMQLVWDEPQAETAASIAEYLKHHNILRLATLEDGSLWCLVEKNHLQQLQAACTSHSDQLHASLLSNYTRGGTLPWELVPDDGYILHHVAHHMECARQWGQLRDLLINPTWLQLKLQEYGVAAVVADLRRYIKAQDSALVKLVLLALQASVGACTQQLATPMLRTQLATRLMHAAHHVHELKPWHQEQLQLCVTDAITSAAEGKVYALLPATPSLSQTGGRQRLLLRHNPGSAVNVVVLMPCGTELITASDDGTLMLWEMDTGECTKNMRVSNQPITAMAVTPDAHWCVTGSAGGHMCVWNLGTDQVAHRPLGHTDRINSLVMEKSGWRVATASSDQTARVWGVETGECQFVLTGHGCSNAGVSSGLGVVWDCAFSDDSRLLGTVSDDFTARIWDASSGQCLHVLEGHSSWVVRCIFVPGTSCFVSASHDGTARVWDGNTGSLQHVLAGHSGRVTRVLPMKAAGAVATASDDYSVRLWDTVSGRCGCSMEGHSAWTDWCCSHDTSALLATTGAGDYSLAVWDAFSGALLDTLSGHTDSVTDVCFSHKGRFVISASDDSTVRVWDLNAPGDVEHVKHDGKVKGLCLVQGGKTVVSIGEDCVMRTWDTASGTCNHAWTAHRTGLNWAMGCRSGQCVISASADRKVCSLDLQAEELRVVLPSQQGSRVKSIAVDVEGRLAAVALYDSTVTLWGLDQGGAEEGAAAAAGAAAGGEVQGQGGPQGASQGGSMRPLIRKGDLDGVASHGGGINAVYISSDGSRVLSISKDTTGRVWDTSSLKCSVVLRGHEDSVNCAALAPDNKHAATASYDRTTRYWDLEDGRCLCVLRHSAPVTHLCISDDGSILACVADDNIITLSRLPSGQQIAWLTRHTATVNGVAFTPDSAHVITFSDDCTLQVWDASTGKLVALFVADDCVCSAVAQQGLIVAGDAGGNVHFLPFPPWEHSFAGPTLLTAGRAEQQQQNSSSDADSHLEQPQQCGSSSSSLAPGATTPQDPPVHGSLQLQAACAEPSAVA